MYPITNNSALTTSLSRIATPVQAAFIASLVLSFIAVISNPVLNRDGMLYIETARDILKFGISGSTHNFDWSMMPLPLLIAGLGYVTQSHLESVIHILDALFMAGTCTLMVDLIRRRMPEAAWIACLVVLAVPAYNGYRDYLIREFGYWFFSTLALWLAVRWEDNAFRWREAIACQIALACAVFFRLEAIVFFPAFLGWQLASAPARQKTSRVLKIVALPMAAVLLFLAFYATGLVKLPARAFYFLDAANIIGNSKISAQATKLIASGVLSNFSKEEAGYILFFGLLSLIPIKLLGNFGILVVPFIHSCLTPSVRSALSKWQVAGWMFAAHLSVLVAFVTYHSFLSGRYVSMLNLLAVPVIAVGFGKLMERFPQWKLVFLAFTFITVVANVVSLSPRKEQIKTAGAWLSANVTNSSRVFVDDQRITFYAGWGYRHERGVAFDAAKLTQSLANNEFDMLVLSVPHKDSAISNWTEANHLQVVQRFANNAGDAVIVITPAMKQQKNIDDPIKDS
jgi:hypothetical protein